MNNTIYIDDDFKDLIPRFLEKKLEDLIAVEKHLSNKDLKEVRHIIHKLKGASGGYGFKEVFEICKRIESYCEVEDFIQIKNSIEAIRTELTESQIVYIQY